MCRSMISAKGSARFVHLPAPRAGGASFGTIRCSTIRGGTIRGGTIRGGTIRCGKGPRGAQQVAT